MEIIYDSFYGHLNASLSGYSGRIFREQASTDIDGPYIVFNIISNVPQFFHGRVGDYMDLRMQIDVFDTIHSRSGRAINDLIYNAINKTSFTCSGFSDIMIHCINRGCNLNYTDIDYEKITSEYILQTTKAS